MVHVIEQREIVFPLARQFGARCAAQWPFKEVGSGKRERSALLAREAAPDDVLPVRAVDDELPDIVAAPLRPSRGVIHSESAQAAPEIRAVPGLAVVRAVDDGQGETYARGAHSREAYLIVTVTITGTGAPFSNVGWNTH